MSDKLLGLVLDRSGSMEAIWNDAVGAYNHFIKEWQEKDPDLMIARTYFNVQVNAESPVPVGEMETISNQGDIYPAGGTALFDAVMHTISMMENETEDKDKVVLAVITDGMENSSKEHRTAGEVFARIKEKEDEGWEILYLGVTSDEWHREQMYQQSQQTGFQKQHTHFAPPTAGGMSASYSQVSESLLADYDEEDDES